jgi:hypothetical protein
MDVAVRSDPPRVRPSLTADRADAEFRDRVNSVCDEGKGDLLTVHTYVEFVALGRAAFRRVSSIPAPPAEAGAWAEVIALGRRQLERATPLLVALGRRDTMTVTRLAAETRAMQRTLNGHYEALGLYECVAIPREN